MLRAEGDLADWLRYDFEGKNGFDLPCASEFDAIINDFQLPGISGYEVCREIKADPAGRKLRVILLTSLQKKRPYPLRGGVKQRCS